MSSIFGDLDIESAADNPFTVVPGTYNAIVSSVGEETSQKGNRGLVFKYTITGDDDPMAGREVSEWKNIPKDPSTTEGQRALSFIKMRLQSLGVPNNRLNSTEPDDLIGTEVVITVVEKDGYTNIRKLVLAEGGSASGGENEGNPFA